MAKRRMFSLNIIDDDVFITMSISAQALYFHLCMRADDDGFVTPLKVMRTVGANQDDLKILIAKRYVLAFDSGVVVIKHWPVQNSVKKDRYIPTTYQKEFKQLTLNEWNVYTEKRVTRRTIKTPLIELQQSKKLKGEKMKSGSTLEPQVRLGKVSIGYINSTNVELAQAPERKSSKEIDEMFAYWYEVIGFEISSKLKWNRIACSNLLKKHGEEKLKRVIKGVGLAHQDKYAPGISDFSSLQSKWNDLMLWGKKQGQFNNVEVIS